METDNEKRRKLEKLIADYRGFTGPFPFPAVIEAVFGCSVISIDEPDELTANLVENLRAVTALLIERAQAHPIEADGPQAAGSRMKQRVVAALEEAKLPAGRPRTAGEDHPSSGYPDYELKYASDRYAYLLIKTYTRENELRAVYISPPDAPAQGKVTHDAIHLVLAFRMERTSDPTPQHRPIEAHLVDLSKLHVKLKYEFQSNMRTVLRDAVQSSLWTIGRE